MTEFISYYIFQLLFIVPVFSYSNISLEEISLLKSISCTTNNDCLNTCKNGFCEYPTYYCLGNQTCIEENPNEKIYYSHIIYTQSKEDQVQPLDLSSIHNNDKGLIIEACNTKNIHCQTRYCYQNSDCFTGKCDEVTHRCLINQDLPLYACINNNQEGGMICGKYLEEECTGNEECLTNYCDTQLSICQNFEKNDTLTQDHLINNNNNSKIVDTHKNTYPNDPNSKEMKMELNIKQEESSSILKEILIFLFVLIPIFAITQYIKSTKFVKNLKRNRISFKYKDLHGNNFNNC